MRSLFLPVAVTLLLALANAPFAAAQTTLTDPNPAVGQWVEASFDVAQPDLRTMEFTGELLVRQYTVDGEVLSADQMGDRYQNSQRYSQTALRGEELVTNLEATIRSTLATSLGSAFPGAEVTVSEATIDRTTLRAQSGNVFDPAVRVTVAATVLRTAEQVGTGDLSDAAIQAVFRAGAEISTTFELSADAGYKSTYTIAAPATLPDLIYERAEGATLASPSSLVAVVDNTAGSTTLAAPISIALASASANPPTREDIATTVTISLGTPTSSAIPIDASISSEIGAIDLAERFPGGALPSSVSLSFLSADALRALVQTGAIEDADLASANQAFLDAVARNLAAAGFETTTPTGGIVAAELAAPTGTDFADGEPLPFAAEASGTKPLADNEGDKLDLALRIGATIRFATTLPPTDSTTTTYVLAPPPGTEFVEGDAGAESVRVDVVDAPAEKALRMRLVDRPTFTQKSADLGITVDLKDLDITIGGAMGGDMGNLIGEVAIRGELGVLSLEDLPEETRAQFREQAELSFLPSDGIRLALQKGIMSESDLKKIEDDLLAKAGEQIGAALGTKVTIVGAFDEASLATSLISTPKLSGDNPIVFTATASFVKPLSPGAPPATAAVALYTHVQTFDLPKFQGLDTEYTVILPSGLSVASIDVANGESSKGTADGREWFTVRPTGETAQASVGMAVTPGFVIAKFWPVLLLAVLIIFLLVGTPIALVVMRRRKKQQQE